jgi:phage terminase small subunit
MAAELKDKQRKFCEEYIIDFNATQAAIRAGYSKKTAAVIGAENLIKPNIQNYLTELKQKAAEESGITKKQLIDELAKIAFFDIRKIYNEDNSLLDIKSFDDDSASAVAGIEVDEIFEQRQLSGYTKKVKLHNKIAAIERVSKMLGYDAPAKTEHTGKDGLPIQTENKHTVEFRDYTAVQP